jgi:hypothetical protein
MNVCWRQVVGWSSDAFQTEVKVTNTLAISIDGA